MARPPLHVLLVGLAILLLGAIQDARAQASPQPSIAGAIYSVVYVSNSGAKRENGLKCRLSEEMSAREDRPCTLQRTRRVR